MSLTFFQFFNLSEKSGKLNQRNPANVIKTFCCNSRNTWQAAVFDHEKPEAVFLVVCDPSMNEL